MKEEEWKIVKEILRLGLYKRLRRHVNKPLVFKSLLDGQVIRLRWWVRTEGIPSSVKFESFDVIHSGYTLKLKEKLQDRLVHTPYLWRPDDEL